MNNLRKFEAEFKATFQTAWCRVGDWDGSGDEVLWSGEDNFDANGMPLFDYYEECGYDVHPELEKIAKKHGFFFECYDAGTYIAYRL